MDLNPIRAAIAETIEDSDYTPAQKRARELQGSLSQTSSHEWIQDQGDAVVSASHSARHLSPVDLSGSDVLSMAIARNRTPTAIEPVVQLGNC